MKKEEEEEEEEEEVEEKEETQRVTPDVKEILLKEGISEARKETCMNTIKY